MKTVCSKCGLNPVRADDQRYCKSCHAEYMRDHRPKHSELNDEQRLKANCRSHTKVYVKRGIITKTNCEVCNNPNSEAHHEDYSNPKLVMWLCRKCHLNLHKAKTYKASA